MSLYGTRVNPRGMISTILLVLAVISFAFFAFLFLKDRHKKKQIPGAEDLPEFCTNCGTKFENEEIMFCVECGKKRGE